MSPSPARHGDVQSHFAHGRARLARPACCLKRRHPSVVQEQLEAQGPRIVRRERLRITNEVAAVFHLVVLHVPAAGTLVFEKPRSPFLKHLALAMPLPADRIVPQEKLHGEDGASVESRLVAAGGCQVDSLSGLLPAVNPDAIVGSRQFVAGECFARERRLRRGSGRASARS